MSSILLLQGPLTSLPPKCKAKGFSGGGGAPLLPPSPLEYPFRHFLSSSDYTEESIRAYLQTRGKCVYRIKVRWIAPFLFVWLGEI